MSNHLTKVYFYDDKLGWAVGLSGTVLHTNDGGQTWQAQYSGNVFELFGVHFVDPNKGYIVGSNATLLEALDSGLEWHSVSDPSDEGHGTAKRIIFSDPASSWKSALGYYDLHFSTPQHGWGVGEVGKIAYTNDGGQTWNGQDSGDMMVAFNNLYGVYSVDANTGWTVGASGTVIKTMDAGQTWEAKIIGPDELRSIYALDAQTAWTVGSSGAIYATTDGGAEWNEQITPTDKTLQGNMLHQRQRGMGSWRKRNYPTNH